VFIDWECPERTSPFKINAGFAATSADPVHLAFIFLRLGIHSRALGSGAEQRSSCSTERCSVVRPDPVAELPFRHPDSSRSYVKLNKIGAAVGVLAASSLVLSACGKDNNSSSSSSAQGSGGSSASGSPSAAKVDCGGKKTLKASGSSAQANAVTQFVNAYETACDGYTLNYTSNGSGAGVKEFIGGQTDFGGSDSPLSADKGEVADAKDKACKGADAWNLPVVFGPIAVTYNIPGVSNLVLDGPTAAKIFNGAITTWNDPAIAALNSGVTLPGDPIHVVFRSDESGTTDNFQKYLDKASDGAWGKGAGKTFNGGVGEGAKGNEQTAAAIKNTPGSITYNEWSFAKGQNLSMAKIVTSAGPDPVEITADSVG
jgi:phosphate transport system substrate-binding protein